MTSQESKRITTPPTTEAIVTAAVASRAPRDSVLKKLVRDPQAMLTASILFVLVACGILAPVLAGGPNAADLAMINAPVGTPGYPLGGDESGRDIFARLLHSINTAVISALIGATGAIIIGVTAGLVGGYFGPGIRSVTEWIFNFIMTLPGLLILIILMPVTGGDYRATMLLFAVMLSPSVYRIVRNLVLGVKNELYVDAARVSGLSTPRILARHVLVIVRGPIIIAGAFMAGAAITAQSGLAFLGVGSKQIPSFGGMIQSGFTNLYIAPTQFLWPALTLGLMTASIVLLGNSLRDAFGGSKPRALRVGSGQRVEEDAIVAPSDADALLTIRDLVIAYPSQQGEPIEVVKGIDLDLNRGEVLGLVGESGSGKSQTAFATLGVLPPEAVILRGSVRFDGKELMGLNDGEMRAIRGRDIAYIPQEPMSNLDPSYTVGAQLVEGVRIALKVDKREAKATVLELLARVGIVDPERTFSSYPHQISGGMAQRVLIAGAVASKPKLLIADEPTTALDVTVQAEILDVLRDLQSELDMAVLLVTHNFGVVADVCDRIAVMRSGAIVEAGGTEQIFEDPQHEYTRMLLDSILDEETVREDLPVAQDSRGAGE